MKGYLEFKGYRTQMRYDPATKSFFAATAPAANFAQAPDLQDTTFSQAQQAKPSPGCHHAGPNLIVSSGITDGEEDKLI